MKIINGNLFFPLHADACYFLYYRWKGWQIDICKLAKEFF